MKTSRGEKLAVLFWLLSTIFVAEAQSVPCHHIFGDANADSGNNNDVPNSDAKANYAPYGIDLPNVPRGRFTNGLTNADYIGRFLNITELIQPFRTARGNDIVRGVNYASAGSGIRDETGNRRGVTSLRRQVINFATIKAQLILSMGLGTTSYLNRCLYSLYTGSNDYTNNYFNPSEYSTSRIYTQEEYARVLVRQYSDQLQALYLLGARKFALHGIGRIGCAPFFRNGTVCAEQINIASGMFNDKLKTLVSELNQKLPNAKFTYINARVTTTASLLPNYGPCCEVASGQRRCVPNGRVCANRNTYIFWDAIRPTQARNMASARVAFNARTPDDASPYDISTLARL